MPLRRNYLEQSRVEELERLLTEAIPQIVIRDSKNERLSLRDYRRNLAAGRERYNPQLPFFLRIMKPEIQEPHVQDRALDLIRTELEPYTRDDKILSATMVITGGPTGGSPVEDILTNVLRRAIIDGPGTAAQAFAECVTGTSCTYYDYRVLTGIRIIQEIEVFQGIKLIPLPSSTTHFPPHIPPLFGQGANEPRVEDLFSKTLLRVELEASPIFHKPSQGYTFEDGPDKHFQTSVKSEEVPDFDIIAFCHALSLGSSCNIRPVVEWVALDFYEIFNLGYSVGGAVGLSWSPRDVQETIPREVSDSSLEEAKLLYKRLMEIPKTTRDALRVPLDRWTKSNGQRDPADRVIDLGIALESLYLNDRNLQGELGFRLAIRASWHLGKDQVHRAKLMKDFRKIYEWRSRAVHSGNLEIKKDKVASDPKKRDEFISHAQELCSQAIKAIIREGSMPDWDAIVLGSS